MEILILRFIVNKDGNFKVGVHSKQGEKTLKSGFIVIKDKNFTVIVHIKHGVYRLCNLSLASLSGIQRVTESWN